MSYKADYFLWLLKNIALMKIAVLNNDSCDHFFGDMLKCRLACYEKELANFSNMKSSDFYGYKKQ